MATINPYLNFPGTTEEAFNFYKSVFGGEFLVLQRFKEIPGGDQMPAEVQDKIVHVALPIASNGILMATDALESMGQKFVEGNNHHICLQPESLEEGRKLYDALSAGGNVEMPFEKAFWGAYFASFKDKYGTSWMINYDESRK